MFNAKETQTLFPSNMCNDEDLSLSSSSDHDQTESDVEEANDLNIEKTMENVNFIIVNHNDDIIGNANIDPIDI